MSDTETPQSAQPQRMSAADMAELLRQLEEIEEERRVLLETLAAELEQRQS